MPRLPPSTLLLSSAFVLYLWAPVAAVVWSFSRGQLFLTAWTVAHQSLLSTEFSGEKYSSELPFPSPEPASPALTGGFFLPPRPPGKPGENDTEMLISEYWLSLTERQEVFYLGN